MDAIATLVLNVWREVGRHGALGEAAARIRVIAAEALPAARLLVRRIDTARGAVETSADVPGGDATPGPPTPVTAERLRRVQAWQRRGDAAFDAPGEVPPEITASLDAPSRAAAIACPIAGTPHVLVLVPEAGRRFTARQRATARRLLEPFATALENERRLRATEALREAAEADRRALLARLGRQDLTDQVIGTASGLKLVMERVALVSRSDVPVLILGETGSGKELVARAIRNASPRAGHAFMRVNCGAIPSELIDSELFGHEKGSFTGAVADRKGWFERADGGTLLLDEIGELPLAAQVRLLQVLQDGTFERVGGHQPAHVDVRIIAATNRDLAGMVQSGQFREDLWYRIAVFPILVPPLRDRREDIPGLVAHFARKAATRFGLTPCLPGTADLELLIAYDWPGNVRELASVIDRAAILGNGRQLDVATALGVAGDRPRPAPASARATDAPPRLPAGTLDDAMRRHIEAALAATRGRIEGPHGAALLLGLNPYTLRGRMRKLGVDWRRFRTTSGAPPSTGRTGQRARFPSTTD